MHHGSIAAGRDRLDGRIQHRVDDFGVWALTNRPAYERAVEAIDHEGEIPLTRRDLELREVGEPLLVGRTGSEVRLHALNVAIVLRWMFSTALTTSTPGQIANR